MEYLSQVKWQDWQYQIEGKIQKKIGSQDEAIVGGYKFVFCHSRKNSG